MKNVKSLIFWFKFYFEYQISCNFQILCLEWNQFLLKVLLKKLKFNFVLKTSQYFCYKIFPAKKKLISIFSKIKKKTRNKDQLHYSTFTSNNIISEISHSCLISYANICLRVTNMTKNKPCDILASWTEIFWKFRCACACIYSNAAIAQIQG